MKQSRGWIGFLFLVIIFADFAHADDQENSSFHAQGTTVTQAHPSFTSPYSGTNSLSGTGETKTSFTSTGFFGHTLWWPGSQVYVDPEVSAGEGLSQTHGVAAFPNGEIYRVDSPSAKLYLSRIYLQQTVGISEEKTNVEEGQNQIATRVARDRFTFILGKFSLNDFFDDNTYSHDPRTQFLNWALMDNGAWDYAADTRGYTWGLYAEYARKQWAARAALALEPVLANGPELDPHFWQAYGTNFELEYRYDISAHPGKVRWLSYLNRAHMGSYSQTLSNPAYGNDVTQTRAYRFKYGFGLNFEQELTSDVGAFMRLGWDNGTTETWAFTEVDRTASLGVSIQGRAWNRKDDTVGVAGIVNGLSKDHAAYLASGGYGFIIGDGRLSYAPEELFEIYYLYKLNRILGVTPDFQYVNHPAYNTDRGPVPVYSLRIHCEI